MVRLAVQRQLQILSVVITLVYISVLMFLDSIV